MAISNSAITSLYALGYPGIFTCPGTYPNDIQEHAVTCIIFCNVSDTTSVNLSLYAIPNGSAFASTHTVIKQLEIPAGETFSFDTEKLVLSTGDVLYAIASIDNTLVCTVSSMRVS